MALILASDRALSGSASKSLPATTPSREIAFRKRRQVTDLRRILVIEIDSDAACGTDGGCQCFPLSRDRGLCIGQLVRRVRAATSGELGIALLTIAATSGRGTDSMSAAMPSSAPAIASIAPGLTAKSPLNCSPSAQRAHHLGNTLRSGLHEVCDHVHRPRDPCDVVPGIRVQHHTDTEDFAAPTAPASPRHPSRRRLRDDAARGPCRSRRGGPACPGASAPGCGHTSRRCGRR